MTMVYYAIDLDRYDPDDWDECRVECHSLTGDAAAERCAALWDERPIYHVGIAAKPDGSDLREYIVVSRVTRVYEVRCAKSLAGIVAGKRRVDDAAT